MSLDLLEPVRLSEDESRLARESAETLAQLPVVGTVRVQLGPDGPSCDIPAAALRALRAVLINLGEGNAVQVQATRRELTTQNLANLLNVSRPYAIGLLERGEIPHRKVGKHRRVLLEDALAYKRRQDRRQAQILDTLVSEAQAEGDYD